MYGGEEKEGAENLKPDLHNDWQDVLATEWEKPYFAKLQQFLIEEYASGEVYPAKEDVWNAFRATDFKNVRVVILGQDPYHGAGQAHGLSFSVKKGIQKPPSLRNMLKELADDLGCEEPVDGTLTKWAEQGVLLLNAVMTVRAGEANSHKGQGWEELTDAVITALAMREEPVIFMLWGKPAQKKKALIARGSGAHVVLESPHPSPLSAYRGFFGSKPYSKANMELTMRGLHPIDWDLS